MMKSFIIKEELEPSANLDPPFWINQMYSISLKDGAH